MNTKKTLAGCLALAMSFSMMTGCGAPEETPAEETTAPAESTAPETEESAAPEAEAGPFEMTVCLASEPASIDPALNSAVDGAVMIQHAFEGLMKWADSGVAFESADDLNKAELVPGQAESHEKVINEDGTVTYTFKIRSDAKWSDGQAVTANDFVYTWQRLADDQTAADYSYMIDMVVGWDEVNGGTAEPETLAVSATDDSTFVVTIKNDTPYFLEICAFPSTFPVRQDIVEAAPDTWTTDDGSVNYIGNGPWKLEEWAHDSYVKMVPNEHHYDVANLGPESLTFQLMNDANAILAGFNSGDLQFITEVPVDETPALLASGELGIVDYVGTYYVTYQTEIEPFNDPLVRQAFTLAINSQYIVEQVTQQGQVPAGGFVPAGIYDADPTGDDFRTVGGDYYDLPVDDATYEANVAKAQELLAEAGYPNGEGFPVVTYLYNTNDGHKAVGEALQSMWQEALGVTVQLQNQEWNAFLESRKNGEFQIARNGWIADYNDPMSFLDMWVTGGGNNDAQYSSAEYDAAIDAVKATDDQAERMALMHEAEDILMAQDWVLGPIYFYTNPYMLKDNIDGVFYTPLGYHIFGYATQN